MDTLTTVMLIIFLVSVLVDLGRSANFRIFALRVLGEFVILGVIYVALHFLIKYW